MDEAKEKALLGWLGCLLDTEEGPASLTNLDYSTCFLNILVYMDSSISLDDYPNTKERVLATKKFLEDFYNTSFLDESLVDFNVLSNATPDAVRKEEIAKVLLLLLCAGIQDKNSDILTAAMKVDASLHWDVRQLIEAVVRPDEPTTSLPADFAKVLLEGSDPGPNDSPGLLHRLVNDNSSLSGAISSLSSAKLAILPEMRDSPLRMRIASLNLSGLNDSLQITSPLRAGDNDFPITPLEELVNSPQLARKIMQKEKEHRFKMERQLKEKEESLKKCQQELRTGLHLRDELELDLQESSAQLQRKDSRIRELEEQVQRLRAVQDRLNELGAAWDSNLELERDVESLRSSAQTAETMTKCCQSLKEENSSLYEDLSTLRDKVNCLEASQLEASKAQHKSDKLRARVEELEAEVERWQQALGKGQEEKRALEVDMEVLKKVNQQQRQQLMDRSGDLNGSGSGESMGVVADKLIAELQAELELMRSTWLSPDRHLATKSDLEASQTALAQLQGESDGLVQKVQELSKGLQEAQTQLTDRAERCQQLQRDVDQAKEGHDLLQKTVEELQAQQTAWFAQRDDLQSQLDKKQDGLQGLQLDLQKSSQRCIQLETAVDDLQTHCACLTSDLADKERMLITAQADLKEKRQQYDELVADLQSKTSERSQLESEKSQAVAERENSRENLEKIMTLNKELQRQMAEQESQYHNLKEDMERKETEWRTLKSDLEDKLRNYAHLEKTLESKGQECSELRNDLGTKESAMERLQKELEERQSELKERELAAEVRDTQCQNLQQMLAEKSSEIAQLSQRCEGLESDLQEQKEKTNLTLADLTSARQLQQQREADADRARSSLQAQLEEQLRTVAQDREQQQQLQALTSQLRDKEAELTRLTSDLTSREEALRSAQAMGQELHSQVQQLRSLNQNLEKQVSEKQADMEELETISSALKEDLTALSQELKAAKTFSDQVKTDHCQAQAKLTDLEETTSAQLMHAKEEWDLEMESLKAAHQDVQGDLTVKIHELEASLQQKEDRVQKLSEELESSQQKMKSIESGHLSTQEELQKELNLKALELDQEKQKHQLSKQQLEMKLNAMEETLSGAEGSHERDHKALQDRVVDLQNSAAAEQMKLNKMISLQQQQITTLEQQVEEQDFIIKQKVKAFLEMEHQHKADVEAFQKTAMSKDKELQHKISLQTQEHAKLMQKLEGYESTLNQKEKELQELKQNYAQALQEVQQKRSQREQDLEPSEHLEEEAAELQQNLQAKDLLSNQTQAACSTIEMPRQLEREGEKKAKETHSVKENDLRTVVKLLVDAIEARTVRQIVPVLTELGYVPPVSVVQLANSVENLLKQTEASEWAAKRKEQELLVRLQEAYQSLHLQTTAPKYPEGSPQTHPHTLNEDADAIKSIQEESNKKVEDLLIRLETQKRQAAFDMKETDNYWKQQIATLQDEMEADMRTQQVAFQNELAEQRAEYDTRLTSMLEEQEGMLVGQKALLTDKLQTLQDTLTSSRAQFSSALASKEAEFAQTLQAQQAEFAQTLQAQQAEAERRVASVQEQLDVRVAEKEAELQQKLRAQEAETEKKLENLNRYLQKEMESHRAIRSQMEQDRSKIHQLESQLAERCRELEELLQTEHVEKGEVVARVMEENQEQLRALQQAQDEERQHSLQQIGDLQAETSAIKEQLTASVRRTETLQKQLSELETQKNDAVQRLEREVQKQIHTVRHSEEENRRLQAKIAELESVMAQRKSELKTLRSSLEQQRRRQAEWESRERELKEALKSQPLYKDQARQLSGQLSVLQAEYDTLQAENKAIQEKAIQSTRSMAEKLKHYERKCQQNETQLSVLADRLRAFTEKEAQWKHDAEKMQELSRRLHELESAPIKSASPDTLTLSESKSSSTEPAPAASRYDLRSKAQGDLDGSFTNTLPATPGAAEKQMAALRELDSMSTASDRSGRYSTYSSGRSSTYSTGSTKSVVFVPTGAGKLFSCEDEPESPKFEWGRLNELQRRNTLCLPHMKSSYPVETQTVKGQRFDDRAIQQAKAAHKELKAGGSSPHSSGMSSSTSSSSSSSSSRKRRPEAMDVDDSLASHAGASVPQSRKLARHGPLYQRPGPPTPLSERHRKLSDPQQSSAHWKKSSTPRRSPRRSPRARATPRRHRCYADENVMPPDPRGESVAFDVGFSPVKTGSSRILTRQKAFLSKSKLPQIPKPDDYDDSPSPSATSPSKSRTASRSSTSQQAQPKGKRKPLGVRNCLHTQL